MNKHKIKQLFNAFAVKAQKLAKNRNLTLDKVKQAFTKATANEVALSNVWQKLQLLLSLTKDYANGTYVDVDKRTIVTIIAGLLYFISPLDFIPDFIVGLGLIDDVFVIGYVYKKVARELENYQNWRDKQNIIHI